MTGCYYREKIYYFESNFGRHFKQQSIPQSQLLHIMTSAPRPVNCKHPAHPSITKPSLYSLHCQNFPRFPSVKKKKKKHCTFTLDKLQRPMTSILCGPVGVNQSHLRPSHSFPLWFATVFPTSTPHLDVSPLVRDLRPRRILDFTAGVDKVLKCWMGLFPQKQQAGEGM